MKNILPALYVISAFLTWSCAPDQYANYGEYDDLYYSSKDKEKAITQSKEQKSQQALNQSATEMSSAGSSAGTARSVDYSAYTKDGKPQTTSTSSGGNTYISNNYSSDPFQDRWNRPNNWCYTCNSSNYNLGSYYNPWSWSSPGSSITFRYSTGWGWNNYYGYNSPYTNSFYGPSYGSYYDPFYNNYMINTPWYGNGIYGYNNNYYGYPNTYYNGYNNGFYNGYYDRYYNGYNNNYNGGSYNSGSGSGSKPSHSHRNQPRTTMGSVINSSPNSGSSNTPSPRRTDGQDQYNNSSKTPQSYSNPQSSGDQTTQPAKRGRLYSEDPNYQGRTQPSPAPSQPQDNSYYRQQNSNYSSQPQQNSQQPAPSNYGGYSSPRGRGGDNNGGSSPSQHNRPSNKSF